MVIGINVFFADIDKIEILMQKELKQIHSSTEIAEQKSNIAEVVKGIMKNLIVSIV